MREKAGILKNQRGATLIMVAISMVAIFAFAVAAIDISMMLLARTQLKNAADAAVLAGASALVEGTQDDATQAAIRFAGLNVAVQETLSPVIITANDITFPDENTIQVTTHRKVETNDPVSLFFLTVIDAGSGNKGSVSATSRARVTQICATDCVKPWCPPDHWDDRDGDHVFDWWDVNKNGIYDPPADSGEWYDKDQTGYSAMRNLGDSVTLYLNSSPKWKEGWYYPIDYPPINKGNPISGSDQYREYIWGCEPWLIEVGDNVQIEPGAMKGPTRQGLDSLVSLDPTAEWDPNSNTVKNSAFAVSPRIIKVCLFDPRWGLQTDANGRKYLTIANIMVAFIVGYNDQGDIYGRFMKTATQGTSCDDPGSFMYGVALVPGPEEQ
jgi:Flp pilus assembly protein TadG